MNAPTPATAAEKSETEISDFIEQESPKHPAQIETDAERFRSSVARLTSNSIDELEGLTSELQALQEFLKSEVDRVQREIGSALDGIKIIIETIAPWKNSPAPSKNAVRGGPVTNTASGSRAYGKTEASVYGAPR